MHACWLLFFVTFLSYPLSSTGDIQAVLINKFDLPYAGFSTLIRVKQPSSTSWALVISCFNPIPGTTDHVYAVTDVQSVLNKTIEPRMIANDIVWPNGIVSADILARNALLIPSGFLVPGKTKGNLYVLEVQTPVPLVPEESKHWFYHDADFIDVNMDGHIDIVAGRANVPVIGKAQTQLIWLKNPGDQSVIGPWERYILVENNGPDIDVQFVRINNTQVMFSNSYFTHKLQMYWSLTDPYWNDTNQLRVRNIDDEPLPYAYIQLTMDLNGDQIPDLLVTVNDAVNGSLIAYELPPSGQLFNGTFKKHVLASGFKPATSGKGRGAPGQGSIVQLHSLTNRTKPIIILSGDDSGGVYLLEAANDSDPSNWDYSMKTILQPTKSTIGQISIEDVDNDGHPEMFVPSYNDGKVFIYRLTDNSI